MANRNGQTGRPLNIAPRGWEWEATAGWAVPEQPPELVRLNDGMFVPSKFTLTVRPAEPAESWVRLLFQVADGAVEWPIMAAGGMNVDAAADVLRKALPMKDWVYLAVTFLWTVFLMEQAKGVLDAEAIAKILDTTVDDAASFLAIIGDLGPGKLTSRFDADAAALVQHPLWDDALAAARDRHTKTGMALVDDVPVRGKPRRNSVTKRHLREVADVYRRAVADGIPPTQAVADHFSAPHSTAARWVSMARAPENGFLRPVGRGRSGEDDGQDTE